MLTGPPESKNDLKKSAAREHAAPVPHASSGFQRPHALEDLNSVVGGVGDVDQTGRLVDDDAVQVAELADAGALLAPHGEEVAVLVEHLDAIVADLGDVDVVVLVQRDAGRRPELALAGAALAPRLEDLAVLVEHLHAVVLEVGDIQLAVAREFG